jgi:4-amino-4-deoxy-L-arabinose transferase-like glycosyltransferase
VNSDRKQLWLALTALIALGVVLVFKSLGMGPLEIYDEGLYGMYARHALHYDVWLHAVDGHGAFPTGTIKFSKPPLSIWAVAASMRMLGPTLFALRLPFALATFAVALIAFAWGVTLERGARGAWLGFTWGALWLMSHGAYHYGRTATIEALLAAFVMFALFAHSRALQTEAARSRSWAALAGLAITGAFFTKQLVCGLAAGPILLCEIERVRSEGWRRPFVRALLALGLPFVFAAAWIAQLWAKVGSATSDVLWAHAVVSRVEGFDGLHHRNYLNRIAEQLDLDAPPLPWALGVLGLVVLIAMQTRARPAREDGFLIGGAFVCAWLAFDVGSQAILPWYAFTLLPPLALGNAWLITRAAGAAFSDAALSRREALCAGAGAGAIVICAALALRTLLPSPLVAVLAALVVLAGAREPRLRTRALAGLCAALAIGVSVGVYARDGYGYSEPDPLSTLAGAIARYGARHVSIDPRANVHAYARATFFGVDADQTPQPWAGTKPRTRFDARIENEVMPRQVAPRAGVHMVRAAGMYALIGDLSKPPFAKDAVARALERGPLTFEAEDMASDRYDTLSYDADASGGALRRVRGFLHVRAESFTLATAKTPQIPPGKYTAKFWLALQCGGYRRERLGSVGVRGSGKLAEQALDCTRIEKEHSTGPIALDLAFVSPTTLTLTVSYDQGGVALDRIEIARRKSTP